jgi:hypothetical protein
LQKERDKLKDELSRLTNEFKTDSSTYDKELSHYKTNLAKLQVELDNANNSICDLTQSNNKLTDELEQISKENESQSQLVSKLNDSLVVLNKELEQNKVQNELNLQNTTKNLTVKLNNKWSEILKLVCNV